MWRHDPSGNQLNDQSAEAGDKNDDVCFNDFFLHEQTSFRNNNEKPSSALSRKFVLKNYSN
jgi:hypothetical protein